MGHVKFSSLIIQEELIKINSSVPSGSKFGIGSSLADITPLENHPGPGAGGCEGLCATCRGTSCGSGTATEVVCASGCGASSLLKVK